MISVSYEQSAITYVWKNDEDTLRKSPSLTTLNAYLIQNQTIPCPIKASWRGNMFLYFSTVSTPRDITIDIAYRDIIQIHAYIILNLRLQICKLI